jgi:hypothetical protein
MYSLQVIESMQQLVLLINSIKLQVVVLLTQLVMRER